MHKLLVSTFCLVAVGMLPLTASAAELHAGEQPSLPASETIADDVYIVGGNVNSSATVIGDLIAGGGNVLINGSVSQDIAAGGGSVTILADVGDDLRVGGGNVTIAGVVGGDVIAGGGQVQISGEGIGGDLVWGGGVLNLDAPVQGDLKIAGGEVFINAPIAGNVEFQGDKLTLGEGAVISGSLTYESPNEVEMKEGATVVGTVTYEETKTATSTDRTAAVWWTIFIASLAALAIGFLIRLVSALVLGLLLHRYTTTMVDNALARPLAEIGRGFVALVVLPIASIILLATVVGVPFGVLGLLAFVGLLIFAYIMGPIILGSLLHKWLFKADTYQVNWKTILLGVVAFVILGLIPVVGWIVQFAFTLLAIGAMVGIKWSVIKEWR